MYLFLPVEQNEERPRRDVILTKDYLPNYISLKVSEWFLSVYY